MELFTTYNDEEIRFLISLETIKSFMKQELPSIFKGLDYKKVITDEKEINVKAKERFETDGIVWVLEGEIARYKNGKLIKIPINKGYGFKKFFLQDAKEELFIALKESKVLTFKIKESVSEDYLMFLVNLNEYIAQTVVCEY